jgi:hypothetical protein
MGSAASSMATPASAARHRGVIAGVAGTAIFATAVTIALVGGSRDKPTSTTPSAPTNTPTAITRDAAAISPAATPAPDAPEAIAAHRPIDAGAPLPVDAGAAHASFDAALDAAATPSTAAYPPVVPKKTPPKKDNPRPRATTEPEDFGATRH